MTLNPAIMKAVENLGYRVTVGEVAAQAGLEVNLAQQGLLALASDAGGHLQVADTGDLVYLFPRDFRSILQNKFWKLRLQEWWDKVWRVLFYLIRISFGLVLLLSILLMLIAIVIIVIAISSSRDSDSGSGGDSSSSSSGGNNIIFLPNFWFPNFFVIFDPGYNYNYYERTKTATSEQEKMNFLEAVFSFLFGDGNPNFNLEEKRWQEIGTAIRNNQGAVIAQQIAPYLDNINAYNQDNEDYIIPVLARFNGYPQVSPEGEIIYYFPELQVSAKKRSNQGVSAYLRETLWRFSEAGSGQIMGAIGLGAFNLILALVLGSLLKGEIAAQLGGFVAFISNIYPLLLVYGLAFLAIPLIRYFWIQGKNRQVKRRNEQRKKYTEILTQGSQDLLKKIKYARQFAADKVLTEKDITYSTDRDLLEQDIERSDKIDEEWQRRLDR
jgi:preprotein translocase subunit SecG